MHIFLILLPVLVALCIAGIFAEIIMPKHRAIENLIYNLLDKIM